MTTQKQAEYLIRKLNLKKDLAKFGETHLVGSVALKTMFKHDIDFQIYVKTKPSTRSINEIKKILVKKGLTQIITRDMGKKFLVSTMFFIKGKRWVIDITLTKPSDNYAIDSYKYLLDYKPRMNETMRRNIIKLKKYFFEKNLLHKNMTFYIYNAVIDCGVKNEKDFLKYLRKNKLRLVDFKK